MCSATEGRKRPGDGLQVAFHENVYVIIGGQFSTLAAWRSNLRGVIQFTIPLFWNRDGH